MGIGILAYGSLIEMPGKELGPLVQQPPTGPVKTPFRVEFARKSVSTRGGAPTLTPVETGGAFVNGVIWVLDDMLSIEDAKDKLWRRETGNECNDKHYDPDNPGSVIIKSLNEFGGLETVLYAYTKPNIDELTPENLAYLAIESARGDAGAKQPPKDGISYLISIKEHGIVTPLMPAYEAAILNRTKASSLPEAFVKVRRGEA